MSTTIEPTISSGSQVWQIDPAHTSVEFSVKHLMIAKVKGRFADVTGMVQGDPGAASVQASGRHRDEEHRYEAGAARRAPSVG